MHRHEHDSLERTNISKTEPRTRMSMAAVRRRAPSVAAASRHPLYRSAHASTPQVSERPWFLTYAECKMDLERPHRISWCTGKARQTLCLGACPVQEAAKLALVAERVYSQPAGDTDTVHRDAPICHNQWLPTPQVCPRHCSLATEKEPSAMRQRIDVFNEDEPF